MAEERKTITFYLKWSRRLYLYSVEEEIVEELFQPLMIFNWWKFNFSRCSGNWWWRNKCLSLSNTCSIRWFSGVWWSNTSSITQCDQKCSNISGTSCLVMCLTVLTFVFVCVFSRGIKSLEIEGVFIYSSEIYWDFFWIRLYRDWFCL